MFLMPPVECSVIEECVLAFISAQWLGQSRELI